MNTTTKPNPLAVLSPADWQITKAHDWKFIDQIRRPTKESEARQADEARAGSTAPTPMEWETVEIYRASTAQKVTAGEAPAAMAIVSAKELEATRVAVAELVEAAKRMSDWWSADSSLAQVAELRAALAAFEQQS